MIVPAAPDRLVLRRRAIWALTLCCVGWAVSFPTLKSVESVARGAEPAPGFHSALAVGLRFSLAALVLLAWRPRLLWRATRSEWIQGAALGFCSACGLSLQMDGLRYSSASSSAFLTQGYCVWIPLWQAFRGRRLPPIPIWGGVVLVAAGSAVLAGVSADSWRLGRGELENLAGSVFFAAQILVLDSPAFKGNSSLRFTGVMFVVMAAAGLGVAFVECRSWAGLCRVYPVGAAAGLFVTLVAVCTLAPFLVANHWQRALPAAEAGLIYCAEPVFTSVVTWFIPGWYSRWYGLNYPNEVPGWRLAFGGGMILAANAWLQIAEARKVRKR